VRLTLAPDEALVLQAQVSQLGRPTSRVYKTLQSWFGCLNRGSQSYRVLSGQARFMFDSKQDLAALSPPADKDMLSRLLQDHWPFSVVSLSLIILIRFIRADRMGKGKSSDPADGTRQFLERHVIWAVSIISVIIAAILLVGAITSLYYVTQPKARLGMIAGFTVLFAISVGLLTSAKRGEIFASAAAYAAVLVVFVSGNLGSAPGISGG
jgi:hypothetical protein